MPSNPQGTHGAKGPVQPFKFVESPLAPPPAGPLAQDDSDSWWAGAQRCFAAVALAAIAVTVVPLPQSQTEVIAAPFIELSEDYGQNYAVVRQLNVVIPFAQSQTESTSAPFVDEDYWQNQVAAVPATLSYPQPFNFDAAETVQASAFVPDEDFWQNSVPPVSSYSFVAFSDDDVIVPQVVFTPDEDFWQSLVPPSPATNYQPLPYAFDDQTPASPKLDEDYWQNSVPAVVGSLWQQLPISFDAAETAVLSGQPDEDFWANPVAPVAGSLLWPQQWSFDVQEPAGNLFGQPDEDYWQLGPAPVPATLYQPLPYWFDANDFIGYTLDEDYWQVSVVWPVVYAQPLTNDDVIVPQVFSIGTDEDFWQNWVQPVQASLGPLYLPDPEELPANTLFGVPEEYFWIPPAPWPVVYGKAFADDDVITQQPITIGTDEDFWSNPTAPIAGTLGRLYLPDPEELPAASLFGQYDEDFWQNPTRPVAGTLLWQQPVFDQNDFIGYTLDEDFWVNAVAPVQATLLYPQQWVFDSQDVFVVKDEDYWPIPAPWPVAYGKALSDDEIIVPQPSPLSFDEDYWQSFPIVGAYYPPIQAISEDSQAAGLVPGPVVDPCVANPMPLPNGMSIFAVDNPGMRLMHIVDRGPLLVRSDYAIWCCICGKFIPKSEAAVDLVGFTEYFKGRF